MRIFFVCREARLTPFFARRALRFCTESSRLRDGEASKSNARSRGRLMEAQLTSYDAVAYPGYTHPQTHPDRLGVVGTLFGLEPAPFNRCRVLELACGTGSNLIPMAWGAPQSEFVGIDLAGVPIAQGQQMIQDLGLTNIKLVHGNVAGITDDWGKFDYIIAHGFYSWIPADVQRDTLNVCRRLLAPNGIAFVSYNALPGCHNRTMLREMMLFHVRGCTSPDERVKQALALMRFLGGEQLTNDHYQLWMKTELERVQEYDPGHLYHDELAEINEPLYFWQFIERAAAHNLKYLGEADYFEMTDYPFQVSARKALEQLGPDRLLREQYMDFLKCRRFRQTLLCHREANVQTEPLTEKITGFLASSAARCTTGKPDLQEGVSYTFVAPRGAKVETNLPLGKAALTVLETVSPLPLRFEELFLKATERLKEDGLPAQDDASSRDILRGFLLRLYGAGALDFRLSLPPVVRTVSERPVVHPIARWQARREQTVTSLLHAAIRIEDEIGRNLLCWLDGSADRQVLVEKLSLLLKSKNEQAPADGNETASRAEIELKLNENLEKIARLGLLMA